MKLSQAGEFWWKVALEASPAAPQPPLQLAAPLGSTASHTFEVVNSTRAEATFTATSSNPDRFWIQPALIQVCSLCCHTITKEVRCKLDIVLNHPVPIQASSISCDRVGMTGVTICCYVGGS